VSLELSWETLAQYGFPIFAYLLLYFDLRTQLIKRVERIEARVEKLCDSLYAK